MKQIAGTKIWRYFTLSLVCHRVASFEDPASRAVAATSSRRPCRSGAKNRNSSSRARPRRRTTARPPAALARPSGTRTRRRRAGLAARATSARGILPKRSWVVRATGPFRPGARPFWTTFATPRRPSSPPRTVFSPGTLILLLFFPDESHPPSRKSASTTARFGASKSACVSGSPRLQIARKAYL